MSRLGARLAGAAIAAFAADAQGLDVAGRYELEWKGLRIGELALDVAADGDTYRVGYEARTVGFLSILFPFLGEGVSEGRREGDRFLPVSYRASSSHRDGRSDWSVRFAPSGEALAVSVPPEDAEEREPVPPALQRGPDMAALALAALAVVEPGVQRSGTAFDGRRAVRFDLACPAAEAEPGLLVCTVTGQQLAGFHRHWKERAAAEGTEERPPIRLFLRRDLLGPGWWPERLEASSRFGPLVARLRPPAGDGS